MRADVLFASGRSAVLRGGKAGLERGIGAAFGVRPAGSDGNPSGRVGPLVELVAPVDSPDWDAAWADYWNADAKTPGAKNNELHSR